MVRKVTHQLPERELAMLDEVQIPGDTATATLRRSIRLAHLVHTRIQSGERLYTRTADGTYTEIVLV